MLLLEALHSLRFHLRPFLFALEGIEVWIRRGKNGMGLFEPGIELEFQPGEDLRIGAGNVGGLNFIIIKVIELIATIFVVVNQLPFPLRNDG